MAFTNRDRLRRRMKSIPIEVRKALKKQNAVNAAELVETMKGFVNIQSGELVTSIKHQDVSDSTRISQRVEAGGMQTTKPVRNGADATYDYALANEFGTKNAPAQPFFWPAWRLKRKRFKGRMSRAAKKAIQGTGK